MGKVKSGDKVKVHYTGQLRDGEVFDTSRDREPIEFEIGGGTVIPGFESGILGMEEGESKRISISAEDAYGPRQEELVATVAKNEFPDHITPELGQELQIKQPDGGVIKVIVSEMDDEIVTLDANHPLAGRTLFFDVELLEII
jgi:peptidylprolyl isomerase